MNTIDVATNEVVVGSTEPIEFRRFKPNFETPDTFPRLEVARILCEKLPGIWFVNPLARVHAACDSEEFLKEVRKRQAEWFRHLSRQLKNGWRKARDQTSCVYPSYNQAFEFDGVIVWRRATLPFSSWIKQRSTNPFFATDDETEGFPAPDQHQGP